MYEINCSYVGKLGILLPSGFSLVFGMGIIGRYRMASRRTDLMMRVCVWELLSLLRPGVFDNCLGAVCDGSNLLCFVSLLHMGYSGPQILFAISLFRASGVAALRLAVRWGRRQVSSFENLWPRVSDCLFLHCKIRNERIQMSDAHSVVYGLSTALSL